MPTTDRAIGPDVTTTLAADLTAAREQMWAAFADPAVAAAYGPYYGTEVAEAVARRSPEALRPSAVVGMEDESPGWLWGPRHAAREGLVMVWDDREATRAIDMCRQAVEGIRQLLLITRMHRIRSALTERDAVLDEAIRTWGSDRFIAETLGIDHTTVWRRRTKLAATEA